MTERTLTTLFSKYLKEHPREDTETYEFKCVKAQSFNLSTVKPWQVEGLLASLNGLWHKIADTSAINGFSSHKPFDAFFIIARYSFVVPIFYKPRSYKKAFLIPVKQFIKLEGKSIKMTKLEEMGFESFYL